MSYKELIPQEEYAQIVTRDTARAQALYDFIMECRDPFLCYKQIRPITNIKQMLESSVELFAERPAFYEKPSHKEPYQAINYAQTLTRVNALGTALHARGLRGAHIAVIGDNGYAWATAYLSVVCGTGVVVPLDKELNQEEIENLLVIGDIDAIFYSKKFSPVMDAIRKNGNMRIKLYINQGTNADDLADFEVSADALVAEGQALLDEGNRDFTDAQIDAEALGILLFTSGTTGVAKGVMLNQRNISTELMIPTTVIGIVPDDVFFSVLPVHHTYEGTCGFLIPLTQGASVAYCEGLRYITDNLAEIKPTVFLGVPLLFENLYRKIWQNVRKQGKEKLLKRVLAVNKVTKKIGVDLGNLFFKDIRAVFGGRMRLIICGGAAIDPNIIDGIKDFGINTIQGYGLTECAPICALNPLKGAKSSSAGYLIPGFDGRIDAPDPETGIGEICSKGANVMMGYYKNEAATAEVIKDDWFYTGDYGYIDEDRFVHITGRKKSVIITKTGKNVFPEELEYLLGRSELIAESMAWEAETEAADDTLIAATVRVDTDYVEETLGADYTDEQLIKLLTSEIDAINAQLPYFKKIKKLFLRKDAFDVTTSKKIRRFVIENRDGVEV